MFAALAIALAMGAPTGCVAQTNSLPIARSTATSAADRAFDQVVSDASLQQAGVLVFDGRGVFYERLTPGFTTSTPLPIASASKWIAAALIMTGVDRGELSLDDTVGKFIPEAPAAVKGATLRQLLSHTSGISGQAIQTVRNVSSLEESVMRIFAAPLARPPGTAFAYGGSSIQVAALMLERATRQPFAKLMRDRLTTPLGMRTARVGSPPSWGTGEVPWVAGGMAVSLDDYRRFLTMILDRGTFEKRRVLSERSVDLIETNMILGVPIAYAPRAAGADAGYGLGVWCENMTSAGRCGRISSAGAFGTYPWLDREHGRAGVFLTRSSLAKVFSGVTRLRDMTSGLAISR